MKRPPAKSFQDLIVSQKAHQFVWSVYRQCKAFPQSEVYGLASQLRREAVSIVANIAEGFKKKTKSDKRKIFEQRSRFFGGVQILPHTDKGPRLWRYGPTRESAGRGQKTAGRVYVLDAVF